MTLTLLCLSALAALLLLAAGLSTVLLLAGVAFLLRCAWLPRWQG